MKNRRTDRYKDNEKEFPAMMKPVANIGLLVLLATVLSACVPPKKERDLDTRLQQYESVIRWSQWDGAAGFLAPEYLEENPTEEKSVLVSSIT